MQAVLPRSRWDSAAGATALLRRVVGIAGVAESCRAASSACCASCPGTGWHHGAMSHSATCTPEANHPSAQPEQAVSGEMPGAPEQVDVLGLWMVFRNGCQALEISIQPQNTVTWHTGVCEPSAGLAHRLPGLQAQRVLPSLSHLQPAG